MPHLEEWKKNWKKPIIEHNKWTKYNYLVYYPENLKIGNYVDISQMVYIQARYGVEIGDEAEIGPFTAILSESSIDNKKGKIIIKDKAKIGAHSTIMPNVTIGRNAIVGAHSFVREGTLINDNEIWFGIPARKKNDN